MLSPSEPSTYTVDSEPEAAMWDPAITADVDVELVSIATEFLDALFLFELD
jgi:hypothetical protein